MLKRRLDSLAPYTDGLTVVAIREEDREAENFLKQNYPSVIISSRSTVCALDTLHYASKCLDLSEYDKTLVITVDSFYEENDLRRYITELKSSATDALMAVTELDDDEKPLYLHCTPGMEVKAFTGENNPDADAQPLQSYVSAGIYGLGDRALRVVAQCHAAKRRRLREFQQALIDSGQRVFAFLFGDVYDLDRPEDFARLAGKQD